MLLFNYVTMNSSFISTYFDLKTIRHTFLKYVSLIIIPLLVSGFIVTFFLLLKLSFNPEKYFQWKNNKPLSSYWFEFITSILELVLTFIIFRFFFKDKIKALFTNSNSLSLHRALELLPLSGQ